MKKASIEDKTKRKRKPKPSGILVHARIPEGQYNVIKKLDGVLGVGLQGVIANIIHSWLYQQDWFLETVKEKLKKGKSG